MEEIGVKLNGNADTKATPKGAKSSKIMLLDNIKDIIPAAVCTTSNFNISVY